MDIPLIKSELVIDPRIKNLLHLSIPKPPEISIPLFSPGWEEPLPVVPKVPRDPRLRKKEVTGSLSVQAPTQNPTFPLLPNLSSDPESSNSLEEGEIPDTVSPVWSSEYWEPGALEIDLDSPVEHVQVEPDYIQLNEIGSSGGKSQTLPTVFGRPLPDRPESVLTIRDLRQSSSPA